MTENRFYLEPVDGRLTEYQRGELTKTLMAAILLQNDSIETLLDRLIDNLFDESCDPHKKRTLTIKLHVTTNDDMDSVFYSTESGTALAPYASAEAVYKLGRVMPGQQAL